MSNASQKPLKSNAKSASGRSPSRRSASLRVLFADDELPLQELIAAELPRMGHTVTVCPDGMTAVTALTEEDYDCLIVDLDMPGLNGIEVIERCKQLAPHTEAIVLTGKGSTDSAIAALRLGAFDYLQKPCRLVELKALLKRVADRRELNDKIQSLQLRLHRAEGQPMMVGKHPSMQRVKALIERVAPTLSTVLIMGETGTGKELAARSVHENSDRADKPFVPVNCGALPENLIESELFGHRKGAFTGAEEHRRGLFEVANGGTLFLDEIGELPNATQATLLRVLESGEIKRVGDSEPINVDVRIVCATHRDLASMVSQGSFREDLMYRINTFEVKLPALRDRAEDVPELAFHLLMRHRPQTAKVSSIHELFDVDVMNKFLTHPWPGNIRELANVIEYASILCDQMPITMADLPSNFGAQSSGAKSLREIEMESIWAALDACNGNKTAAAQQLGISLKTLYNKLNADVSSKKAG
jgi:two-component system NtrC family response regulator